MQGGSDNMVAKPQRDGTQILGDGAWLRTHWALLIALGASAALHVIVTVGTPIWLGVRQASEAVQFDAVLSPSSPKESATAAVSLKPVRARVAPRRFRPRVPRPLPTPKSEAAFDAPENAIAVNRPAPGDEVDASEAIRDISSKVGDTSNGITGAEATPPEPNLALAAAEKPLPSVVPAPTPDVAPAMELPSRISIAYNATTSVADGVANYKWKRKGDKYEFVSTIQAEGFFVNMFAGTITQESTGTVTPKGLEPDMFTIRRGDREAETAEFLRSTGLVKLSRGSVSRQVPLPPNLQDTQSFLFQLAIEAPKLKSAEDRLTIMVTNARGLNSYTFKKVGEGALETRLGTVETVHLVRETSEPRDNYEAWLSPKHHYLPVKLKFFVDRFPAELIATNITSAP